jgi:histidinol-phosphate aminotransferase
MPSIAQLLRSDIAALDSYTPIVPLDVLAQQLGLPVERIIKLDANENPYGPSPRAIAALNDPAVHAAYAVYPDPECRAVRAALSSYIGQPSERIICGAGADELIDLLLRLCVEPGEVVIDCPPTFGMYSFDAGVQAAKVVNVERKEDFSLDPEELAEAITQHKAKIVFLTSPNNPTGNLMPRNDILRLLELPVLVVVDEAYAEFSGGSVIDLVGQYENLVVLRTLSKWAGLAGLRIGYGVMHEELAQHIWKIRQPYNVSVPAQVAALASFDDMDHLRDTIRRIIDERARLYEGLRSIAWLQPYPSEANFILCRVDGRSAREVKDALAKEGILVRYYNKPNLRDCIRISVGKPEHTDAVLAALRAL